MSRGAAEAGARDEDGEEEAFLPLAAPSDTHTPTQVATVKDIVLPKSAGDEIDELFGSVVAIVAKRKQVESSAGDGRGGGPEAEEPQAFRRKRRCPTAAERQARSAWQTQCLAQHGGDDDIPEHDEPLPPKVVLEPAQCKMYFQLGCEVNLQELACSCRGASYNPRSSANSVVIRQVQPVELTAQIYDNGAVTVVGCQALDDEAKAAARRLARMVQQAGHPDASFQNFQVTHRCWKSDLGSPIRLDKIAMKWGRHIQYNTDVSPALAFLLTCPRCTIMAWSSGKLNLKGALSKSEATEALRRVYPLFREG